MLKGAERDERRGLQKVWNYTEKVLKGAQDDEKVVVNLGFILKSC